METWIQIRWLTRRLPLRSKTTVNKQPGSWVLWYSETACRRSVVTNPGKNLGGGCLGKRFDASRRAAMGFKGCGDR